MWATGRVRPNYRTQAFCETVGEHIETGLERRQVGRPDPQGPPAFLGAPVRLASFFFARALAIIAFTSPPCCISISRYDRETGGQREFLCHSAIDTGDHRIDEHVGGTAPDASGG